jgi:hypothetical protein
MTAVRFLKIFDKVGGMIPLNFNAEIRVEYGDENFFPSTYYVDSVTSDHATSRVLLEPPRTTCKARDRRMGSTESLGAGDSCCTAAQPCC